MLDNQLQAVNGDNDCKFHKKKLIIKLGWNVQQIRKHNAFGRAMHRSRHNTRNVKEERTSKGDVWHVLFGPVSNVHQPNAKQN